MTINPSRFVRSAPELVVKGWRPLPGYADTKRPSIKQWQTYNSRQWEPDELQEMIAGQGQAHGETVCLAIQKELVAIDLDVLDEQQAQAIYQLSKQIFGVTPLERIGLAPKRVLIYRNDGSIRSKKLHPIEVFSGSGQIVAFGFHAKANQDYHWPKLSPLDIQADDPSIPTITYAQVEDFLEQCWSIVPFKDTEQREWEPPQFIGGNHQADRQQALDLVSQAAHKLMLTAEGTRNNALFNAAYIAGQAIASGLVERISSPIL